MIYLNQGALQNYVAGPVLGNERLFEVDFTVFHILAMRLLTLSPLSQQASKFLPRHDRRQQEKSFLRS